MNTGILKLDVTKKAKMEAQYFTFSKKEAKQKDSKLFLPENKIE